MNITTRTSLLLNLQATAWWAAESLINRISRVVSRYLEARAEAASLREAESALQSLSDRDLRDMGLTRGTIGEAVRGMAARQTRG